MSATNNNMEAAATGRNGSNEKGQMRPLPPPVYRVEKTQQQQQQQKPQQLCSPPKYQPPPQPQDGILKNLAINKKRRTANSTPDSSASHFIGKCPPEMLNMAHSFPESSTFAKLEGDPSITKRNPSPSGAVRLPHAQNKHFQANPLVAELRSLKEENQRLRDDNQELRDLCCFLDDDRQKGRKLAREWQRFGRYTASVMRQEVSAYQNKLRQLDDKQQELIRDNLELKELCLYLDEERSHRPLSSASCRSCGTSIRSIRDDADGSSSGTNDDILQNELSQQSIISYQTLQYVRSLEQKLNQMEQENSVRNSSSGPAINDDVLLSSRPEAVIRALQILEVREQLENDTLENASVSLDQMDDGERALVREMCNVVWRKLEEVPGDSIMDPL